MKPETTTENASTESPDNMRYYNKFNRPAPENLKTIKGGRLSGMSDINPQWRIKALTELFGPCGEGWWDKIEDIRFEPCGEEIACFVRLHLHVRGFEHPVEGTGGNMFRKQESSGLHCSDEAIKMAVTDALGVCCKKMGIGGDIYEGKWDGSKYVEVEPEGKKPESGKVETKPAAKPDAATIAFLKLMGEMKKALGEKLYYEVLGVHGHEHANEVTSSSARRAIALQMKDEVKALEEQKKNEDNLKGV